MVQLLWKTVWQFLKKLNTELLCDLAIPHLGIHSKELKTYVHIKTCMYVNVHNNIIHNSEKNGSNSNVN